MKLAQHIYSTCRIIDININREQNSASDQFSAIVYSGKASTHILPVEQIARCAAKGNYCLITMIDETKHLISKTLKDMEMQLPIADFVRVHQSHLIRWKQVREISASHLILECGDKIPLARRRRKVLMNLFR